MSSIRAYLGGSFPALVAASMTDACICLASSIALVLTELNSVGLTWSLSILAARWAPKPSRGATLKKSLRVFGCCCWWWWWWWLGCCSDYYCVQREEKRICPKSSREAKELVV